MVVIILSGVLNYQLRKHKFHQQDKIDDHAAPGQSPVLGMGLSKYPVATSGGTITLNYIMIGDKNQVRFSKHPRISIIMKWQICLSG